MLLLPPVFCFGNPAAGVIRKSEGSCAGRIPTGWVQLFHIISSIFTGYENTVDGGLLGSCACGILVRICDSVYQHLKALHADSCGVLSNSSGCLKNDCIFQIRAGCCISCCVCCCLSGISLFFSGRFRCLLRARSTANTFFIMFLPSFWVIKDCL